MPDSTASDADASQGTGVLEGLAAPWPEPLLGTIAASHHASGRKLVVLDDDPTGTQTVHDVAVVTSWDRDTLRSELQRSDVFYVLTNSRAMPEREAVAAAAEIGTTLRELADELGVEIVVDSRSDSTLRGHFPAELDALCGGLGDSDAIRLLVPFFAEGGRLTVHGTHYVRTDTDLVPVADTEFARDRLFGYANSWLPDWVQERTGGAVGADDVVTIDIDTLRRGGPDAIADILAGAAPGTVVVGDAVDDGDIEVLAAGVLAAEAAGRRIVYRTAASFVRIRAGIERRDLLDAAELIAGRDGPPLVIVGSHVQRTGTQLEECLALDGVSGIALDVDAVLVADEREPVTDVCVAEIDQALSVGRCPVLYTSRGQRTGADPAETMLIGQRVSDAVCEIVERIRVAPSAIVAKGGITASDVATEALGVRRAVVLGQIQPGVPVWRLGPESRHPGCAYVVYPGNVGPPSGLADVVATLRGR